MRRRTGFTLAELLVFMALAASVAGIYAGYQRATLQPLSAIQAAMSADGSTAAAQFDDRSIRVWDTKSLRLRAEITREEACDVNFLCLSPSGDTLLLHLGDANQQTKVVLWNVAANCSSGERKWKGELIHSVFSPRGDEIASIVRGGTNDVVLWKPEGTSTQIVYAGIEYAGDAPSLAEYSPDGSTLAIGCINGDVKFWPPVGGKLRTFADPAGQPVELMFSADGRRIAEVYKYKYTYGPEARAFVWDYATGKPDVVVHFPNTRDDISRGGFLPAGRLAALCGRQVCIYDLNSRDGTVKSPESTLLSDNGIGATCLATAPRGDHFVIGSFPSVVLYNAKTLIPEETLYDATPDPTLLIVSFPLAVLTFTFLIILLVRRRARACRDCGKRFSPWRNKNAAGEIVCPHCRAPFNLRLPKPG